MAKVNKKNTAKGNDLSFRINDELHGDYDVRVIGEGLVSSVMPLTEAKALAESMGLDLIEMNRYSQPPLMRVATYDKMLYEMKKAAKKNRQSAKPLKEVQLSVSIAQHDMETKANNARRFISEGSTVKVVLSMKGREMARREENKRSIFEFIDSLNDVAVPESMPKDMGNRTIVILKKKN